MISRLIKTLAVVLALALPGVLYAIDCTELYKELSGDCGDAIDIELCYENAKIAYCNCMGVECG